ncbi:MAG: ComEC/Rec2 family competence protein [Patescibacteria group bacterium]|nr:ComEC/Rec2 family competence protein [Patescibacteria group bacterium]
MKKRRLSLWIIIVLLSFCLGLVIYSFWPFKPVNVLIFLLIFLLSLVASWFARGLWKIIPITFLCLILGYVYADFQKPQNVLPNNKIQGIVNGFRDCSRTECRCPLKANDRFVVLKMRPEQDFLCVPGNELKAQGQVQSVKYKSESLAHGIDYYLLVEKINLVDQKHGVWFGFLKILLDIKQNFSLAIGRLYGYEEAIFARGLVLGEKQDFSFDFKTNLQKSGTSHLVALSGFNISILILALFASLKFFSKKVAFVITSISILGFILMTGAPTSVVRAGLVGEFLILAEILGRQNDSGLILVWSLFLISLFSPFALAYDVSLQLSFSAFLGIVYLAPLINKQLHFLGFLGETISQTLGATLFTLPLVAYYFGQISLISLLPNVLVISVVPITTYLIMLSGIFYFIFLSLAHVLSFVAQVFLDYMLWIINFFGTISFSVIKLKLNSPIWLLAYYLVFTLFLIYWWKYIFEKEQIEHE